MNGVMVKGTLEKLEGDQMSGDLATGKPKELFVHVPVEPSRINEGPSEEEPSGPSMSQAVRQAW